MPKIAEIILFILGTMALTGIAFGLFGWGIIILRFAIKSGAC